MPNWEEALTGFLKDWTAGKEVTGALVCGSYVTGSPSKRSDIDVHIILADDTDWRERGNRISDGFLIEYFANPPQQIRRYFQEDFHDGRTMSMVQFITGKIIFDPTGVIAELKSEAAEWFHKTHDGLNDTLLELKKYAIWDVWDNLKDGFEQERADFHFTYYNSLCSLFTDYCTFLNLETLPAYQIHAYLSEPAFIDKYLKKEFPDEPFRLQFLKALQETDRLKMMHGYEALAEHVLHRMGGFSIDGWKVRSPLS